MVIAIVLVAVWGMGNSQKKERLELIEVYQDSVGTKITETADKAQNMLKIARKYADQNSQLEPMCQAIESKLSELTVSENEQVSPEVLKEIYALTDTLSAELKNTALNEQDQRSNENFMAEILSLKDQIGHLDYNKQAAEWNAKQDKFPASLLKAIKINGKQLISSAMVYVYGDL